MLLWTARCCSEQSLPGRGALLCLPCMIVLLPTRGAVRLYSDFYQSDIIVASPLGLATRFGEAPAEGGDAEDSGSGPADFLSSVEVAVVARADVMTMQNWAHVKLGADRALHTKTYRCCC